MPYTATATQTAFTPTATHPTDQPGRGVRRGETLYYAGDAPGTLYRLESGLLRAVRLTSQGRNLTVRHIYPGDIFGEEALERLPRHHQVVALTDAVLTPLHVEHLGTAELLTLGRSLANQLQRTIDSRLHTQDGDLRGRIARYLLMMADTELGTQQGGQRHVQITHELIAEGIGATRESVSKLIGEMRDDGLLLPAYRSLALTDEAELRALAGEM